MADGHTLTYSITIPSTPSDNSLNLMTESTPKIVQWDGFSFSESWLSICAIDSYKVYCTDPDGNQHETDYDGTKLSGTSIYCNFFVYDTASRTITFDTSVWSEFEGDYTFTVEGCNSNDCSKYGTIDFTYSI